jgi:deoxyribodipyrimidine photo-lyase
MEPKNALFWHRRDIRIADNSGLHKALIESDAVIPVFIFDTYILDRLPKQDARVSFLHHEISELKKAYQK